jgi:predicted nuclease with RNAse H fold
MSSVYVGIDVQMKRGCCFALVSEDCVLLDSGWASHPEKELKHYISRFAGDFGHVFVGIDAPRLPHTSKREWYWDGSKRHWRKRRKKEKGSGRHCEIVISAHGKAKPQWTPLANAAPNWMMKGFEIYRSLNSMAQTYEVFPTASYTLLRDNRDVGLNVNFSDCWAGPKDILDSWVAAITVREFIKGRGCEVGGGDGLGTIILPRPLPEPVIQAVLEWPKNGDG